MKERGFTLIELLVVVSVICVLAAAAGYEFSGWQARYRVESQIKQTYADLLSAKQRAMMRNVPYLTVLSAKSYTICEDTNGDNVCSGDETNPNKPAGAISTALSKSSLGYAMISSFAPGGAKPNTIAIDGRGLTAPVGTDPTDITNTSWTATVWLPKSDGVSIWDASEVDYDCVTISTTRIKLGKYDPTKSPACQAK